MQVLKRKRKKCYVVIGWDGFSIIVIIKKELCGKKKGKKKKSLCKLYNTLDYWIIFLMVKKASVQQIRNYLIELSKLLFYNC